MVLVKVHIDGSNYAIFAQELSEYGKDLENADLSDSVLRYSNLSGTNLTSNLFHASMDPVVLSITDVKLDCQPIARGAGVAAQTVPADRGVPR